MAKVSLGRGLGALISDKRTTPKESPSGSTEIEIKKIKVNRYQPRHQFNEDAIKELASSIKEKGIIQPLLVRPTDEGAYELIAGERRFRASKLLGLKKVPVVMRDVSDEDSLELALIENIQRENLSPIEEALAYQRLTKEFKLTQEQVSEKVGKKRATISNILRLLSLPEEIQNFIQTDQVSMGHARAILSLPSEKQQKDFALRVIAEGLSVREVERMVTDILHPSGSPQKKAKRAKKDSHVADLERRLEQRLGTNVKVHHKGKAGKIEIQYYSMDDFDRILEILGVDEQL